MIYKHKRSSTEHNIARIDPNQLNFIFSNVIYNLWTLGLYYLHFISDPLFTLLIGIKHYKNLKILGLLVTYDASAGTSGHPSNQRLLKLSDDYGNPTMLTEKAQPQNKLKKKKLPSLRNCKQKVLFPLILIKYDKLRS